MDELSLITLAAAKSYTDEHGGGGGGTSNYNDLSNKPQIGGVTLTGNKTASDLGLVAAEAGKGLSSNDYTNEDKAIVGGVTAALAGKQDSLTAGQYIDITNDEISVNRELIPQIIRYHLDFSTSYKCVVTKFEGETQKSQTTYDFKVPNVFTIDDAFTLGCPNWNGWVFTLLKDSTEHSTGYTNTFDPFYYHGTYDESFPTEDLSGYKLVIKSELDAALAGKQDTLTFDNAPTDGSNNPVKSGGIYSALTGKADTGIVADDFDSTASYVIGNYCIENGKLYRFKANHSGAWAAADVDEIQITGELATLKSGLTNLDSEVNGDVTTYPYADVITIPDAVPANLDDCTVKIEPDQDLHGFDHPWVGGAGKNKCAGTYTTTTNGGVTFTANSDGTVSATDTSSGYAYVNSSEFTIKAGAYIFSGAPSGNSKYVLAIYSGATLISQISNGTETSVTFESDTNIVVRCVVNGADVATGVTYKPMIRLSTETDATFAPYTNICPITGHTEASVQRVGKNLFDKNGSLVNSMFIQVDGTIVRSTNWNTTDYQRITPNTYTMSGATEGEGGYYGICWYDGKKAYIGGFQKFTTSPQTVTIPSNAQYVRYSVNNSSLDSFMLELGSTATQYVPYSGKTYTIALGDTIYGGTVDFDSGVMTVDRAIAEFDGSSDENWSYEYFQQSYHNFYINISDSKGDPLFSELFVNEVQTGYGNGGAWISGRKNFNVCIGNSIGIDTVESFKAWLSNNPLQAAYPLETPFTVQLTPQQIQLLQGTNTLYASTGDISVTVNGVSGSIGGLTSDKQDKTDYALETTDKTVVGAINELLARPSYIYNIEQPQSISDLVGKFMVVGKICFFQLSATKVNVSYNLGVIRGISCLAEGVIAYDNVNDVPVHIINDPNTTAVVFQIKSGATYTNPTVISGMFFLA